jgi:hypothetical protein
MFKVMNRVRWKWLLPTVLLALTLACHVYDAHVYRAEANRQRKELTLEYYAQHSPAWPARVSEGISFPALVLAYPLKGSQRLIYAQDFEYTAILICPYDLAFFLGVGLFWYWAGRTADEHGRRATKGAWPRSARIAGLFGGALFGVLAAADAYHRIAGNLLPGRQIGAAGMVWACLLIAYFTRRLARELRRNV